MLTNLKNSNGDKTETSNCEREKIPKLKLGKRLLKKNSNCDQTQIVTKLKLSQNSNCYKTQNMTKLKL